MSRRRRLFGIFAVLFLTSLFVASCEMSEKNGETQLHLNPNVADNIEEGGEAAVGIAEIMAPFLGPAGGILAGSLASALALFKKYKPKLTQSQTKAELSHTVATISVDAIEQIKKDHPEVWKKLSAKLQKECEKSGLDTKIVKNAIRGLRGLPAKA